ncbi:hypothetical protein E3N88_23344 [Mikania micrantha]|uniref:Reverse transcriptase domain-containing protein n=1 Tax=Mikania micrantha TaxID=192012 RepID=A0A5N6NEG9_9ASTR|nr:hypothetical protein E3N88_23344 [Mikania micrantha]
MEADESVPIILGRPFLRTSKAIIDVFDGKLTLRVGDETVTFEVVKSMRHPDDHDDFSDPCHFVYFINSFMSHIDRCLEYVCGANLVVESSEEECEIVDEGVGVISEVLEIDELREESKKPSVESPPALELKVLPSHLEYAFLGEDSTLPVVISSWLSEEERKRLLGVLRLYKGAIAWRIFDIQGISPAYSTHRILMEDEYKPVVQPQRRLNPNMQEVVKKEVLKLMDAGLIYPISDSSWVSLTQVVPKMGGMTVITNEKNELIPSRTVTGWRVCIDYRKLNDATRKDHFPLPFIDQMLERLAGQQFYCFLDGFSGCMVAIFQDMIESSMEVFMDDFSVYVDSFDQCLVNLERMLKRCVETKLMLNWEKCHFMVTEGVVLGHKISRAGIEVDKAKIETLSKLPHLQVLKPLGVSLVMRVFTGASLRIFRKSLGL